MPFTPPTLSGYNSSPPSDDGQRTASNAVRWATHLSKIGNPLKNYAQALSAAVAAAFDSLSQNDIPHPRTPAEIADGVQPVSLQYEPGDVRRFDSTLSYAGSNWFCYGQTATRINNTTFTVPGDYRTRYYINSRVRLTDNAGGVFMGRVQNSTFGSVTRVVVQSDGGAGFVGNVPTTITSLSREETVGATYTSSFTYEDAGGGQGPLVWNRSNNAAAYGEFRIFVGNVAAGTNADGESIFGASSGLAIRATPTTRVDSLLSGGTGLGVGATIVLHTGQAIPIIIGTNDQERLFISSGTSAIIFLNAEEAARFVSPRSDDNGGSYVTFYENDNTTRKGRIGFDDGGTTNRMAMVQEETAAPMIFDGGNKHVHTNPNKAFVFDVLDEYADDAAAAVGGVEVGELYRTASVIKQRVA